MKQMNISKTFMLLSILLATLTVYPTTKAQDISTEITDSFRSPIINQRVLLIGDSQTSGAFGVGMMSHITAAGAVYFTRAGRSGWGVDDWWRHHHNIQRLVERHHPTLVLIELGGNDSSRSRREDYVDDVVDFWNYVLEQAEENKPDGTVVSYCWISPATAVGDSAHLQPGREEAARIIRSVIGSYFYVESGDITGDYGRTADGLHFTHEGGMDWASRIIPRIEECIHNQQ